MSQDNICFADQTEPISGHFEKAAQCFEQTGDRHNAGKVRFNIANMYFHATERDAAPARQRDLLGRAQAFTEAALRDFQYYQGRVAADEAKTQRLFDCIIQALAKLQ